MSSCLFWPVLALLGGVVAGATWLPPAAGLWVGTVAGWVGALLASTRGRAGQFLWCLGLSAFAAGSLHGALMERTARAPPLRAALAGILAQPVSQRATVTLVGTLNADAERTEYGAAFPLEVRTLETRGWRRDVGGGVRVATTGALAARASPTWTAGRLVALRAVVRRVARYDDPGVPDRELQAARQGTVLVASVKSAALVDVRAPGGALAEAAARARRAIRSRIERALAADPATSAIVTAILIGDRAGLSRDDEEALQRAGTFHVLAISGGNVALFAGGVTWLLSFTPLRPPARALLAALAALTQGAIVEGGPSVARAVATAVVYFASRAVDLRVDPWHLLLLVAAGAVVATPALPFDVGAQLTFLATTGIVLGVPRLVKAAQWLLGEAAHTAVGVGPGRPPAPLALSPRRGVLRAGLGLAAATTCAEVILLPVNAWTFGRVPIAGLAANFVAVPAMAVVQAAALALVVPGAAGALAAAVVIPVVRAAAWSLVHSAHALTAVWWLSPRVPPPSWVVVAFYYAAAIVLVTARRRGSRLAAGAVLAGSAGWIVAGLSVPAATAVDGLGRPRPRAALDVLSMTALDVGQGTAIVLRLPDGDAMLVDSGGLPDAGVDVGARVVVPALWALGIHRLSALVVTHGHPDHVGGVPAVLDAMRVERVWDGIEVPGHEPTMHVRRVAALLGASVRSVRAGTTARFGDVAVRVLAPRPPEWERHAVRNDDSVVLDVRYGRVSIVVPGDAGAIVEREMVSALEPAALRVQVAGHHGSRTASTAAWIARAAPVAAVVSCGRDNRYGHPAAETVDRYRVGRADVFRTDQDGAVSVETDGREVWVRTWSGRAARYAPPP